MGTRSLTLVIDKWKDNKGIEHEDELVCMYRQMDGYVSGHGQDLVNFFKDTVVVNGFDGTKREDFNGINCLAAALVAHFKKGIGGIYLYPIGSRDVDEEYIYRITLSENKKAVDISVTETQGYKNSWREDPPNCILENSKPTQWFIEECNKE